MIKTKSKEIKQKIVSTLVIVAMVVMVFSTLQYKRILADSNVTMSQTVSAGSLTMSTVTSVAMNAAIAIATATNSVGNLLVVNVIDYRGSGLGWTAAMYASNWNQVARESGVNNLSNAITYIAPGALGNYNSSSHTGIAVGGAGTLDGSVTLYNASSGNGMGAYFLGNSELNIIYDGGATLLDGTYQATSTLTIV